VPEKANAGAGGRRQTSRQSASTQAGEFIKEAIARAVQYVKARERCGRIAPRVGAPQSRYLL
jgi:hypothetical protein